MKKPKAQGFGREIWVGALLVVLAAGGIGIGVGSLRTPTSLERSVVATTLAPAPLPQSIRVATFNIHGGRDGSGKKDLALTARTITGFNFIGMQEVTNPYFEDDQAQQLGKLTDMKSEFFPSERQYWRDAFGNAMLTSLPVYSWERFPLLALDEDSRRNAAIVKLGDKQVTVIVTHIARHEDQYQQLKQVSDMFLAQTGPTILMGDFNATSQHPVLRQLLGTRGVVSALDLKHPELSGKHIDWIFVRNMNVIDAGTRDMGASDHPLVWAELGFIE